jgi:hypothetical protein
MTLQNVSVSPPPYSMNGFCNDNLAAELGREEVLEYLPHISVEAWSVGYWIGRGPVLQLS